MATKSRPVASPQYLTASALYNAGFRGWPLVVMTAIPGRESSYDPVALNNDPQTGDYSVGLFQINYFDGLGPSRTQEYGTPAQLQKNPQAQANAAYNIAGGNSLSGLSAWNMQPSPVNGQIPPPLSNPGVYALNKYFPGAMAAVAQVMAQGPAPTSVTSTSTGWGFGVVTTASGGTASNTAATNSPTGSGSGCNQLTAGRQDNKLFTLPHTDFGPTRCEMKALLGGLMVAGGAVLMLGGAALVVVTGLGGKGPAAPVVAAVAPIATRTRKAVSSVGSGRAPAAPAAPRVSTRSEEKRDNAIAPTEESRRPRRGSAFAAADRKRPPRTMDTPTITPAQRRSEAANRRARARTGSDEPDF